MDISERQTGIRTVGGGMGGVTAALAATSMGMRVLLTEPTRWLGGYLTSQGVPPDQHRWIEHVGCTRGFRKFQNGVRAFCRGHYPPTPEAHATHLHPGNGTEPGTSPNLAPDRTDLGAVRWRHGGDTVCSVTVRNRGTGTEVHARSMQGATEPGDLLPVAGWEEQYIREARRIRAVVTVTQAHVGATARGVMRGEPASGTSQWHQPVAKPSPIASGLAVIASTCTHRLAPATPSTSTPCRPPFPLAPGVRSASGTSCPRARTPGRRPSPTGADACIP